MRHGSDPGRPHLANRLRPARDAAGSPAEAYKGGMSPGLRDRGLSISHIHGDGALETHEQAERRLAQMFELPERDLFRSPNEIIAEAYRLQGEKIAYQEGAPALREDPPKYGN